MILKIIIASGGSGGHLFPALKVAEKLKADADILFVGPFRVASDRITGAGFDFKELSTTGLTDISKFKWMVAAFKMLNAIIKCLFIIKDFGPDVICGFGGYGAFPVVIAAKILRIPCMIHEQNVDPGKANKLLSGFADKIAISFKESKKYFPAVKTVLTGCPCLVSGREYDRDELLKKYGLKKDVFTILVFGGSQGSSMINEKFLEAIGPLKENIDFQVIHLAGNYSYLGLRKKYKSIDVTVALFEFLEEIEEAYYLADLIIARSGALTVHEIFSMKKRSILIPYPYAGEHQVSNAKAIARRRIVSIIQQKSFNLEKFVQIILGHENSRKGYPLIGDFDDVVDFSAAEKIADEIKDLTQKK